MARIKPVLLAGMVVAFCGMRPLSLHDFHTSLTQIQLNSKEKVLEISVRVFTDDLEKALTADSGQKVQVLAKTNIDPLLEKYIRKHFNLTDSRKQRRAYAYVGHEAEGDANWIYIELPVDGSLKTAELQQDVLMELFDDQVNLVNTQVNGQRKTYVFKKSQPVQAVTLIQ